MDTPIQWVISHPKVYPVNRTVCPDQNYMGSSSQDSSKQEKILFNQDVTSQVYGIYTSEQDEIDRSNRYFQLERV